jgi:molecular chaperone GrpE
MSNVSGGWQPGPGDGEPPQAQHDTGAEDDGSGAAGPGGVAAVAGLEARLAEAEDQKLRALADLDNLRKRCTAQVERAEADARTEVARQWLPVVDNLERALEHAAADPRTIVEGIQAVRQQALSVLAGLGFPRRDDTGAAFDPARHEAIAATYDPRVPPGTIVQVVRPGYGEPGRQLRPAQVVVAKAD